MTAKLNIPVAVWRNRDANELYAFPLASPPQGAAWSAQGKWNFECVLGPGTSVTGIRSERTVRDRADGALFALERVP